MTITVAPCVLKGKVAAPPSKSFAHRMLICASLAQGTSQLRGIGESEDVLATVACLRQLGAEIRIENGNAEVRGGIPENASGTVTDFDCGESASTLRFMLPVAMALRDRCLFTGSPALLRRGIGGYEELLSAQGVRLAKDAQGFRTDGRLRGGKLAVPGNLSSQYTTGLMLALPLLPGRHELRVLPPRVSVPYTLLTAKVMEAFGAEIRQDGEGVWQIGGGAGYRARNLEVEGDWSAAAVWFALKSLGHEICVTGLDPDSAQGDRVCTRLLAELDREDPTVDVTDCPDLAPVLFVVAAAKHGALFTGTGRLAAKESDRVRCMASELAKFGVRSAITDDTVRIMPGGVERPTEPIEGHGDHRLVMALTMLSLLTGGTLTGTEAVAKSYPRFFEDLKRLGLRLER